MQTKINFDTASRRELLEYFITKFEAIPAEQWCGGSLKDESGACCVMGHCGVTSTPGYSWTPSPEIFALARAVDLPWDGLWQINDVGGSPRKNVLQCLTTTLDTLKGELP